MSPAPAIATRAFAVASSSVAVARFGSRGAEIAARPASNSKAAPDTSARIFRVMRKLLFIFKFNAGKIPRKKKNGCAATSRREPGGALSTSNNVEYQNCAFRRTANKIAQRTPNSFSASIYRGGKHASRRDGRNTYSRLIRQIPYSP